MAYHLSEIAVNLIMAHIKANIGAALLAVRTDRNDPIVTTEDPKAYFIYPRAKVYDAPAVFIVAEGFDFRPETGWNFVSGTHDIKVAVVVEDKTMPALTIKAWRYQAALSKLLNQTTLQTGDLKVKIVTKLLRNTFSGIFSEAADEQNPMTVFHKEVICELEVEHYEQL